MFIQSLRVVCAIIILVAAPVFANPAISSPSVFEDNSAWAFAAQVSAIANGLQINHTANAEKTILFSIDKRATKKHLISRNSVGDSVLSLEYLLPQGAKAQLFMQGRYAIPLDNNNNEWQTLSVKFRAPRFNEASQKTQAAVFLDIRINGELKSSNLIVDHNSEHALTPWESDLAPTTILLDQGALALRNVVLQPADFSALQPPENSAGVSNAAELVDYVALGKDTFASVGCNVCHSTLQGDTSVSTGPNLFGLFKAEARTREVAEAATGHRFTIKADREYLQRSVRNPTAQLAITEQGSKKGEAYPALMPAFNPQTLSDMQINAIAAYLATLNLPEDQGPAIKLVKQEGIASYNPIEDRLQLLVDDRVRIQRGPLAGKLAGGVSGRAIHVGLVNGVNYSFDPRLLAIVKLWQGGFLDMTGEWTNRGGKGLKLGYDSHEIDLGEQHYLFAPLNAEGKLIDFSFKEAIFGDQARVKQSLENQQDHLTQLAAIDAQFLGYSRESKDPLQAPRFDYRIGQNRLSVRTHIAANGELSIQVQGELKTAQVFALNRTLLQTAKANLGQLQLSPEIGKNASWTLPAGTLNATLTANISLINNPWHAPKSNFNYRQQPLTIQPATANLPAGYRIENYYPPKDNFGREQLFEALGLANAADGSLVVATRTAGIWRLLKGQWQAFAEGTFDSLGVLVEDEKGLSIVVGQKAELTRISDTDGDGIADSYQTLFDAHSYHGNYHTYLHGPVKGGDGAYYINLNLADGSDGSAYNAGGKYMGSSGGFSGWTIRIDASNKQSMATFTPWANGLRSPAGMALSPDNRLWYSENQGEYVGTSKLFLIEKNAFYGHPASLVDLPGMMPNSAAIQWKNVASKRAKPVILLPHNRVANSPGSPVWDTSQGKFGAFAGQMLIGDQTQSNLLRVSTEWVDGTEQGSVMPFIDGLESGVLRPLFLADGSLLLGQTGRGWQAKGGHVASLQRIVWDGKTIAPAIKQMRATVTGFELEFTQPLQYSVGEADIKALISIESWVYRDAADYGSNELGLQQEAVREVSLSADRKHSFIHLSSLTQAQIHPQQSARIYHLAIHTKDLFVANAVEQMQAYYTLYKFPSAKTL